MILKETRNILSTDQTSINKDKEEERKGKKLRNYCFSVTSPPFFNYFCLPTVGGEGAARAPQPLCLTPPFPPPTDAHADFATLYVICAHCNLLSVRIERASRL